MAEALLVLNIGIHAHLAGGASHIRHAGQKHEAVRQIGAPLEGEIVDGGSGHRKARVTHGAGTCDFIDPGDQLSAEQSSGRIDVLISNDINVFYLGKRNASLGTGITGAVVRAGTAKSDFLVVHNLFPPQ